MAHPVTIDAFHEVQGSAGEVGGFLEGALDALAVNFEKDHKLRSTVKSAMTYPVMVLMLSLVAVIIMLTFIVPIFKTMFEGLGSALPAPSPIRSRC